MKKFQLLEEKLVSSGLVKRWENFQELECLYRSGFASIQISPTNAKEIIAFIGLWSTDISGCVELGTFWVDSNYSGHGLGKKIFSECCENIASKNLCAYLITAEKTVQHFAEKKGWIKENDSTFAYKIRPSTTLGRELYYLDQKSMIFLRVSGLFSP